MCVCAVQRPRDVGKGVRLLEWPGKCKEGKNLHFFFFFWGERKRRQFRSDSSHFDCAYVSLFFFFWKLYCWFNTKISNFAAPPGLAAAAAAGGQKKVNFSLNTYLSTTGSEIRLSGPVKLNSTIVIGFSKSRRCPL